MQDSANSSYVMILSKSFYFGRPFHMLKRLRQVAIENKSMFDGQSPLRPLMTQAPPVSVSLYISARSAARRRLAMSNGKSNLFSRCTALRTLHNGLHLLPNHRPQFFAVVRKQFIYSASNRIPYFVIECNGTNQSTEPSKSPFGK